MYLYSLQVKGDSQKKSYQNMLPGYHVIIVTEILIKLKCFWKVYRHKNLDEYIDRDLLKVFHTL
jgi:hypothetical protein